MAGLQDEPIEHPLLDRLLSNVQRRIELVFESARQQTHQYDEVHAEWGLWRRVSHG